MQFFDLVSTRTFVFEKDTPYDEWFAIYKK